MNPHGHAEGRDYVGAPCQRAGIEGGWDDEWLTSKFALKRHKQTVYLWPPSSLVMLNW